MGDAEAVEDDPFTSGGFSSVVVAFESGFYS